MLEAASLGLFAVVLLSLHDKVVVTDSLATVILVTTRVHIQSTTLHLTTGITRDQVCLRARHAAITLICLRVRHVVFTATLPMHLPRLLILLQHDLLFDRVNILLARAHPSHESMVLLLEVLAAFLGLIILKRQLHKFSLSTSLALVRSHGILLVFVDARLKLAGTRLVATILLVHLCDFSYVSLADFLVLLDLLLDLELVLVDALLQGLSLVRGVV